MPETVNPPPSIGKGTGFIPLGHAALCHRWTSRKVSQTIWEPGAVVSRKGTHANAEG